MFFSKALNSINSVISLSYLPAISAMVSFSFVTWMKKGNNSLSPIKMIFSSSKSLNEASCVGFKLYLSAIVFKFWPSFTIWNLLGITNLSPITNFLDPGYIAFATSISLKEKPYLNAIFSIVSFADIVCVVGVLAPSIFLILALWNLWSDSLLNATPFSK